VSKEREGKRRGGTVESSGRSERMGVTKESTARRGKVVELCRGEKSGVATPRISKGGKNTCTKHHRKRDMERGAQSRG